MTPETRKKLSEAKRRAWREGKYANRPPRSQLIPREKLLEIARKAGKKRRGKPATGLQTKGRADHAQARHWKVRGPSGVIYEFDNLAEWCRTNLSFFEPDPCPTSKTPLWKRAHYGIMSLQRKDNPAKAYRHFELAALSAENQATAKREGELF